MDTINILVVDDDRDIRDVIEILLTAEGYHIVNANNGEDALAKLKEYPFSLIILDIMMPKLNGYQTCLKIRSITNIPILFLSAKSKESDKTLGFSSGGDDYLVKPFSYNELTARVKALLRRYFIYRGSESIPSKDVIHVHDLTLDLKQHSLTRKEELIELTDTEFNILLLLVQNRHQSFSAEVLYEHIWKEPYFYSANNTVMVHIRNLRKKIEFDPQNPKIIKTIWGKGYRCD